VIPPVFGKEDLRKYIKHFPPEVLFLCDYPLFSLLYTRDRESQMSSRKQYLKDYFIEGAKFHGNLSPGLTIGIFMVDLAEEILGPHGLVDAVAETQLCLPDAVQIMTPCSYGNGWLRVKEWGKFAITLYDKDKLEGVRVYLDMEKVKNYPNLYHWYMRDKEKVETQQVVSEIMEAERAILSWERVRVKLPPKEKGPVSICPSCGETYPAGNGELCPRCSGKDDYYQVIN
jgi:formylmethanofuran dehydrogenase subunit E